MTDLIRAGTALAAAFAFLFAASRAWRGWLELKRFEIEARRARDADLPDPSPAVRIEMANLKERLRRLEAIAQGVDL